MFESRNQRGISALPSAVVVVGRASMFENRDQRGISALPAADVVYCCY